MGSHAVLGFSRNVRRLTLLNAAQTAAYPRQRQRSGGIWIRAERVLVKPLSDTSLLFETC
jgi:hypothetical protein